MTGFNHGMTGAVIAIAVKQPVLAVPFAFLSHFATDVIPHFGLDEEDLFKRHFNIILLLDFLFGIMLMAALPLIFPQQVWLIWACMIAAASPDLMWAYHRLYIERIKKLPLRYGKIASFHHKVQWSQAFPGIFIEAIWFLLMLIIILSINAK